MYFSRIYRLSFGAAFVLILGTLLLSPKVISDDKDLSPKQIAEIQEREKIITLIEDDLSSAYSFDSESSYPIPHYEKLDGIHPLWHHGDPATGRQFWLTVNFQAHLVHYRVDSIHFANELTAFVRGKRLIVWTRNAESSIIEKRLWTFQYWANLNRHPNSRCVKCVDVTYAVGYNIKLKKKESGNWVIDKEELFEQPKIPNKWEENCALENYLKDWGFVTTCGKKSKSLF